MGAAGEKKDVDAIWAQLNAKTAGKGSSGSFGRVWESIKTGNDPVKPQTQKKDGTVKKAVSPAPSGALVRAPAAPVKVPTTSEGLDASGAGSEEELLQLLQRNLFGVKDAVVATRKNALTRLLGCAEVSQPEAHRRASERPTVKPGQDFQPVVRKLRHRACEGRFVDADA